MMKFPGVSAAILAILTSSSPAVMGQQDPCNMREFYAVASLSYGLNTVTESVQAASNSISKEVTRLSEGDKIGVSFKSNSTTTQVYATVDWGDGTFSSTFYDPRKSRSLSIEHTYLHHQPVPTEYYKIVIFYTTAPFRQGTDDAFCTKSKIYYVDVKSHVAPTLSASVISGTNKHATLLITCSNAGSSENNQEISIDWGDHSPQTNFAVKAPASKNCQNLTFQHNYRIASKFYIKTTVSGGGGGSLDKWTTVNTTNTATRNYRLRGDAHDEEA